LYELLEEFPTSFFNIDLKIPKIGNAVLKILKSILKKLVGNSSKSSYKEGVCPDL
jgi:hypothetical protein